MSNLYIHSKKSQITFSSNIQVATLNQEIEAVVQASFSPILTLAGYLLHHMPMVPPPNYSGCQETNSIPDTKFPEVHMTYNSLYEPWCDYITQLYTNGKVQIVNDNHSVKDSVSDDFISKLNTTIFTIREKQIKKEPFSEIDNKQITPQTQENRKNKKKIAVINFATSQLRKDKLQPKMHISGLFTGLFFSEGDDWKTFNALARNFPTMEEYSELDTIILSGSSLNVNDDIPQVNEFIENLKKGIQFNPKLKILGICFGHQALAKIFGGKIVRKQLLTGVESITFDENLIREVPYFQKRNSLKENTFELSEYHKDFVVEVPESFNVFATSSTCKIEALVSKNMKYLSFQFHPQYSAEYIKGFQMRSSHYQTEHMSSIYSKKDIGGIRHNSSLEQIRIIMRNFMDWKAII